MEFPQSVNAMLIQWNQILFDAADPETGALRITSGGSTGTPVSTGYIFNTPGPVANQSVNASLIKINNVLANAFTGAGINVTSL